MVRHPRRLSRCRSPPRRMTPAPTGPGSTVRAASGPWASPGCRWSSTPGSTGSWNEISAPSCAATGSWRPRRGGSSRSASAPGTGPRSGTTSARSASTAAISPRRRSPAFASDSPRRPSRWGTSPTRAWSRPMARTISSRFSTSSSTSSTRTGSGLPPLTSRPPSAPGATSFSSSPPSSSMRPSARPSRGPPPSPVPLARYREVFETAGLELVTASASTAVANNPIEHGLPHIGRFVWSWRTAVRQARKGPRRASLVGRVLSLVDRLVMPSGVAPSGKILLFRRPDPAADGRRVGRPRGRRSRRAVGALPPDAPAAETATGRTSRGRRQGPRSPCGSHAPRGPCRSASSPTGTRSPASGRPTR